MIFPKTTLLVVYSFFKYLIDDIRKGRFVGLFFVGIGNLLPDLLAFGVLRPLFWAIAGVRFLDYSSCFIRFGNFTEYPSNLTVGRGFLLNRNCTLDTNGNIYIGDYVWISYGVFILTTSHSGIMHDIDVYKDVTIKSHCLIYANSTVLPGTTLEEGVVVAAGSIISGTTVAWSVYAGIPARFIKFRSDI